MFEGSLLESTTHRVRTSVRWYFLATLLAYSFALSMLIVGSTMLVSPSLKEHFISAALVLPPPPPPPAPAGRKPFTRGLEPTVVSCGFRAPALIPRPLPPTVQELPEVGEWGGMPEGVPGGVFGGEPGGQSGGIVGGMPDLADPGVVPPPPHIVETPSPATPRRISGGVLQGQAIRRVQPVYPPIALSARVSGPVQIEVVIDEHGNVLSAVVVQGHPLLQQAALDAARQWKFRPTRLNSEPIKVTGVLIFNFRL